MNSPTHWLVRAVAASGGVPTGAVRVRAGMPTAEVWDAIMRATGMTEASIAELAAPKLRVAVADLEKREKHSTRLIPERTAREHRVLPLRDSDRQIVVATSDPMDFEAEQALGFASGRTVKFELAGPAAIERTLRLAYPAEEQLEELLGRVDDAMADAIHVVQQGTPEDVRGGDAQTPPIVKLTNLIISDAIREETSDIHIEPAGTGGVVRFRVDGVLRPFMQIPLGAMNRVISRIKVLAEMDIADRVRPQDGSARIMVGRTEYDLRVSTVPVSGSEKAVVRVLYPKTAERLDELKLPPIETSQIRRLLGHRDGIVIVTGPTGSGKTTTLYAALRELATGKVNITTVEDPVEYELDGITQIQIETKRGVTFASALRAILRQDPDVVLVGEVRDQETAQVALQASLTGHLVLATLHTNDAPTVVSRLLDLGLDPQNVAAALRGALAQRLVRRACTACAQPVAGELTENERRLAKLYGTMPAVRAVGCDRCSGSGYRGRIAVLEVLTVDARIEAAIAAQAPAIEIRRLAVAAGMRSMHEVALQHVAAGITTLDEVERVLGEPDERVGPKAEPEEPAARPPEPVPAPIAAAPVPAPIPPSLATADGGPPHVLVVDDDEVLRDITAAALTEAGLRVSMAADGVEALEHVSRGMYDLVLLDLDMPRMNGIEVLRRLRTRLATATLPVIVVTANRDAEITVMEEGGDDYVAKPLDPPRLLARVRAVLRRRGVAI